MSRFKKKNYFPITGKIILYIVFNNKCLYIYIWNPEMLVVDFVKIINSCFQTSIRLGYTSGKEIRYILFLFFIINM